MQGLIIRVVLNIDNMGTHRWSRPNDLGSTKGSMRTLCDRFHIKKNTTGILYDIIKLVILGSAVGELEIVPPAYSKPQGAGQCNTRAELWEFQMKG